MRDGAYMMSEGKMSIPSPEAPQKTPLDAIVINHRRIQGLNNGAITYSRNYVQIVTDPNPWAYSAYIELHEMEGKRGPVVINVRLQVDCGKLGVMALRRGSSVDKATPEQGVGVEEEPIILKLHIPAIEKVGNIVFRSWPHDSPQAQARIFEVYARPDTWPSGSNRW
jgi:hypothetical protein